MDQREYDKSQGISVIVPFLNEESAIPLFCQTMEEYLPTLGFPVELVFVNDGSTDRSVEVLRNYPFRNVGQVKLVDLTKNYGSHAAARAGFANAYYDMCTWFGMDLQEPLEIIPISYQKLHEEGLEAVYFEKRTVQVSKANRLFSKVYSYLMKTYAVKDYSADGTATIAFGPKVKAILNQNVEGNSSLMLQIIDYGFRHESVALDYLERSVGESRWTLAKKIKLFIDSFVAFSFMPIRLVSLIGIAMFLAGILVGIFTVVNKLCNPTAPIGYSTLVCIMAMGFGITNISLGIIAEYLWRAYDAARGRPVYIISSIMELKSLPGKND